MQSVGLGTTRANVGHDKDSYRTHEYGAAFELVETIYDSDDTLDTRPHSPVPPTISGRRLR